MTQDTRHASVVDVHLILMRENRALFGLRQNTGYEDGKFHFPAGHLEAGESVLAAAQREGREELDLTIAPTALRLVHLMHRKTGGGRIAVFFSVETWNGEPRNAEPEKCGELSWLALDRLPLNVVPYARQAIAAAMVGQDFSLDGWPADPGSAHELWDAPTVRGRAA